MKTEVPSDVMTIREMCEAFEVTPQGTTVWHLVVSGTTTMFRVEPIDGFTRPAPMP